jgi:protein-S-isoprenylcysteine O-methyltransferase Ste14
MNNLHSRTIRAALAGYIAFFALIFIPAWTFDYWQGWAFFVTLSVPTTLVTIYMALYDKKLLERRLRMGPAVEKTPRQRIITAVGIPTFAVLFVVIIFDHRFHWSPAVPSYLSLLGDTLGALGLLVYFLVVRENRYAASTIEIVEGQTVVSTGPYAIIRHPMYAGALLVFIGAPLALGSWWGLLFTPLVAVWFGWRLLDEEELLRKNLQGYAEYMRNVPYHLVPYIW